MITISFRDSQTWLSELEDIQAPARHAIKCAQQRITTGFQGEPEPLLVRISCLDKPPLTLLRNSKVGVEFDEIIPPDAGLREPLDLGLHPVQIAQRLLLIGVLYPHGHSRLTLPAHKAVHDELGLRVFQRDLGETHSKD